MIWKAIAGLFYVELGLCLLLLFPILSAKRWKRVLNSSLMTTVWSYVRFYFHLFGLLLIGLFVGAVREMQKQQTKRAAKNLLPEETNVVLEKLFRAQRNFFVSLFTALLLYVLYRIGTLVLAQGTLELEAEDEGRRLREVAADVTRVATERNERVKKPDPTASECKSAKDEIEKLKKQLQSSQGDKELVLADIKRSRADIENLSRLCSEMRASLAAKSS